VEAVVTLISLRVPDRDKAPVRRSIYEVLGVPNAGASRRGSTYYKAMQLCPREFGLKYVAGVSGGTRDVLTIGWLFHYLLELYYGAIWRHQLATAQQLSPAWLWGGANEGAAAAMAVLDRLAAEPGYREIEEIARATFVGYLDMYDRADRWRIIAVEETLEYLRLPEYTGRLDLLVEDYDRGGFWIVEHKTATRITADLLDNYQMDGQVLGQQWLLKKVVDLRAYPPFRGVLVNISKKGTEKKPPEFTRVEVCSSDRHLQSLERTLRVRPKLLPVYAQLGWPQWLGNCSGFARGYSKCEFYNLCHDNPHRGVDYWTDPGVELPDGYSRGGGGADDADD
jgi:hypothetical protein